MRGQWPRAGVGGSPQAPLRRHPARLRRMAVYAAMQDSSNRMGNLKQHKAIIDALLRENEEDVQDAIVLHINHSVIKSLKLLRNSDRQA